ncbi:MAG: hypothetical protein AUG74_05375 [Bacteroidetes bacterium 13_1_20CM_4_60_6]|nr:MAG: hypothetical protein AUG74_05375 [Bacteroidetes bacterium 13_1_20CM_4_60_6]
MQQFRCHQLSVIALSRGGDGSPNVLVQFLNLTCTSQLMEIAEHVGGVGSESLTNQKSKISRSVFQ